MTPLDTGRSSGDGDLVDQILRATEAVAAGATQREHIEEPCRKFIAHLRQGAPLPDAKRAAQLLLALRNVRAIQCLRELADVLVTLGRDEPEVLQHFAQGLIEAQQLAAGIAVAAQLEASTQDDPEYNSVAHGLLARAYKQIYTDHRAVRKDPAFAQNLQLALSHYMQCYEKISAGQKTWPAINIIAILERARLDGLTLEGAPDGRAMARRLIDELSRDPARRDDPWTAVTIAQAHLALGDVQGAAQWFGRYVQNPKLTAFALFGTIRQLEEVWGIKAGTDGAEPIVMALKTRLLQMDHGFIELSAEEQKKIATTSPEDYGTLPEAVLGVNPDEGFLGIDWMMKGVERSRAVVRICRGVQTMGTGFLVRGDDFAEALGDELFVLTNAHVICPADLGSSAVAEQEARIVLDLLGRNAEPKFFRCEIVWCSPMDELDATLLRVLEPIEEVTPLRLPVRDPQLVAESKARGSKPSRLYVLGHPKGGDLALSFADTKNTLLVDFGPRRPGDPYMYMHYRTPTQPGCSGSPVFEHTNWDVVGLHRAGPDPATGKLRRLNGEEGFQEANEGVYLPSIRRAIRERFTHPAAASDTAPAGGAAAVSAPQAAERPAAPAPAPTPARAPAPARPKQRLTFQALTELLGDPRTPERDLAPYFKDDEGRSGPCSPEIVLDWETLADGKEKQASHLQIVGLASFLARRRAMLFDRRMHEQAGSGLCFVAEGDAWLEYPIFIDDLVDHLSRDYAIRPVAADRDRAPGLCEVADPANLAKLLETIAATRAHGLLLSAGGSDLFGPSLEGFFKPFAPDRQPSDYVLDSLTAALRAIDGRYRTILDHVLSRYPNLKVFIHGYDLPAVKRGGRWLAKPLAARNISDPALQTRLTRIVLDRLNGLCAALARAYQDRVVYVDCRGAVGDDRLWRDELHPDDAGFARIADRFRIEIAKTFGG